MAAGTIEDRIEEGRRSARMMVAITAAGAAACVLAMSAVALTPARPAALYASMDKRDGSDALVNAILVARGSSMPTSFVSSALNIDPQMPFRGTQDLHARRGRKAALKGQRAMMQQLAVADPTTQFCTDAADCMRDIEYFQQNAQFHQAAHDMIAPDAMPPNAPTGYAWCDPEVNPDLC